MSAYMYYVCNALQTNSIMDANTMSPDQTAPPIAPQMEHIFCF